MPDLMLVRPVVSEEVNCAYLETEARFNFWAAIGKKKIAVCTKAKRVFNQHNRKLLV